jgi:hypothetical protein
VSPVFDQKSAHPDTKNWRRRRRSRQTTMMMMTQSNNSTFFCQKRKWDNLSASAMQFLDLSIFMNDETYDDEDTAYSALLGAGGLVAGQENSTAITNNGLYPTGMFTWLPCWPLIMLPNALSFDGRDYVSRTKRQHY